MREPALFWSLAFIALLSPQGLLPLCIAKRNSADHRNSEAGRAEGRGDAKLFSTKNFGELSIDERVVERAFSIGWKKPTKVQAAVIPLVLQGRDVIVTAETGSGKTGAYLLPFLHRLLEEGQGQLTVNSKRTTTPSTKGLILVPTRELATQSTDVFTRLAAAKSFQFSAVVAVGGLKLRDQERQLMNKPTLVVGTTGRIIDHLRNFLPRNYLSGIFTLVLDEADRLLMPGFELQILELLKSCRESAKGRQTSLFSATLNSNIKDLSKFTLKDPIRIRLSNSLQTVSTLRQEVLWVDKKAFKEGALLWLLESELPKRTIIFTNFKYKAHRLAIILRGFDMSCVELHGDLDMQERLAGLDRFAKGHADYMISSDLGARGLDIQGISCIVNLDAPRNLKTYIHRVGRTARIGLKGTAITIFSEGDESTMREVLTISKKRKERPYIRTLNISRTKIWRSRIRRYEGTVTKIMKEELRNKTERMQLLSKEKALNMQKHKEEIHRREKRTWFQTQAEKQKDKEAEALANGLIVGRQRKRLLHVKKKRSRGMESNKAQQQQQQQQQGTMAMSSLGEKQQQTKDHNSRNCLMIKSVGGPKQLVGASSSFSSLMTGRNTGGNKNKLDTRAPKMTTMMGYNSGSSHHGKCSNVILDGPLIKSHDLY